MPIGNLGDFGMNHQRYWDPDYWCGNGPRPWPWPKFIDVEWIIQHPRLPKGCFGDLKYVQRVVSEKEVEQFLKDGWLFNAQLKSGAVIMEKYIDVAKIAADAIEAAIAQERGITVKR